MTTTPPTARDVTEARALIRRVNFVAISIDPYKYGLPEGMPDKMDEMTGIIAAALAAREAVAVERAFRAVMSVGNTAPLACLNTVNQCAYAILGIDFEKERADAARRETP